MKPNVKERCTRPNLYYRTAQDVLEDDALSESEKEFALKTMAAQAELLNETDEENVPAVGDHPPVIAEIHAALSELGEPHAFPDQKTDSAVEAGDMEHIVAAISGNCDVDTAVCKAARKAAEITKAHVHFVSVITHVTDPTEYGVLAPVGSATVAPHVGIRRLDDERAERRREFGEVAQRCTLPDAYSIEVRTGLIDEEIIKAADEGNASLIIVGSGEKTWLDGILPSDVAREVTRKADRPVLVIPEKGNATI